MHKLHPSKQLEPEKAKMSSTNQPSPPTTTSSSPTKSETDENNQQTSNTPNNYKSKRNNPNKRRNNDTQFGKIFEGSDPRLKGYVFLCHGEPGRKPNQAKRTVNKVKEVFSQTHESAHLLEPIFRLQDVNLSEPPEPTDPDNRI